MMEIHQLRYVREVHRQGSFTAASDALHVSQSGISAQVGKLERELGIRIFERGSRTASLTAEGELLLPLMTTALTDLAAIERTTEDLHGVVLGTVRIGTVIGCTIPGYLNAFAKFRADHPNVTVTASEADSIDLIARLVAGSLDLALLAHSEDLPDELDTLPIIDEHISLGVAPCHPWAARNSVALDEFTGTEVLTLASGTGVRAALDHSLRRAGLDLSPAVEAHSPDTLHTLAERGAGVAVLSPSMISAPLRTIPIKDAGRARLSLASRRVRSRAAHAMLEMLASDLDAPPAA